MSTWKKREDCQKFRHHGLQRSGTNFLEGLMYRYFEVWWRNGGSGLKWKHSLEMAPFEDDMFYLIIAKNPYSWVESIAYRNPLSYKKPETSILDRKQDSSKTEYYLSEKPKNLTDIQIREITKNISKELFDFFEYEHL